MAEYRTIRMAFWNDPFIENLDAGEKLLYLYLFTCPHTNNLGILEVSRRKIAFETGLNASAINEAIKKLEAHGKVVTDGALILLTRFIRHQTTTSPKISQSLKVMFGNLTSQKMRESLCYWYPEIFGVIDTVRNPMNMASIPSKYPTDRVSIPSREEEEEEEIYITTPDGVVVDAVGVSPRPEHGRQAHDETTPCHVSPPAGEDFTGKYAQGTDALPCSPVGVVSPHGENLAGIALESLENNFHDSLLIPEENKPSESKSGKSVCPPCPHEQILAAYHEALPELPRVKVWDGARKSHLQARWRERWKAGKYATQSDGMAYWERLFRHVRTCDWLMGRVTGRDGRAFKASLGWLVRPENFAKLIEGRYDRQEVAA